MLGLESSFPLDPETVLWDAIVIGTGMGGGTIGYELAKAGKKVLFLEKGNYFGPKSDCDDKFAKNYLSTEAQHRIELGFWPDRVNVETTLGAKRMYMPLGCGTGGSSLLYAGHLERFFPSDFSPKENYQYISDSTLPEKWPISYSELLPYYEIAETLYRVRGTTDPLRGSLESKLLKPADLGTRGKYLYKSFLDAGLNPYYSHIACDFKEGCSECGNVICKFDCKNDANKICVIPAIEIYGAKILPNCEVTRLEANKNKILSVSCNKGDTNLSLKAREYILSAGSLGTPNIMLNSANEIWPNGIANSSGYVGRNLMFHASDFVAVTSPIPNHLNEQKSISLNDFYHANGLKLGTVQSAGILIDKWYIRKRFNEKYTESSYLLRAFFTPFVNLCSIIFAYFFKRVALFAIITEDLPYYENRVYPDKNNSKLMNISYCYTSDLRKRSNSIFQSFKKALNKKHYVFKISGRVNINFGHSCGTCRFGDDPKTSVLNRDNRTHDISNLWICDASFFPSSGGTNPSLTIAANAIRVAEKISKALDSF